jgi:hypothetical protein
MRTRSPWLAVVLPLCVGHLVACGGADASPSVDERPPSGASGAGTGGSVRPPAAPGTYQVESSFDLSAAALAPEATVANVRLLRSLHDDPMGTFVHVLDEAGVPLVHELRDALPDVLEDEVGGWFNDALLNRSVEGQSVGAELDLLLGMADTTLVRFDLLTDLSLREGTAPAGSEAPSTAVHAFRGIRYDFLGGRLPVEVLRFVDERTPIVTETELPARITAAGAGDARLELGDHAFGVPYGQYAFAALDRAASERYGVPLRGALGQLVGCASVAHSVAAKCVGFACVGHEGELTALCESGLDHVVEKIRAGFQSYDFDAVRLRAGHAELRDVPAPDGTRDGRIDSIAAGVWDAAIDIGQGPREVRATFTGRR